MQKSYYEITTDDFFKYIKYSFSNLFDYSGRSSQKEYFIYILADMMFNGSHFLLIGVLKLPIKEIAQQENLSVMITALGILVRIFIIYFALVGIACAVRRMHDQDKSGWWFLLYAILIGTAVVGAGTAFISIGVFNHLGEGSVFATLALYAIRYVMIYLLMFGKPTEGDNRFGELPFYE
jgi:uncharacterized membrane protein YhaH (DUF805 family)